MTSDQPPAQSDPSAPPIEAPGRDLAAGTTHGVEPGGHERPGPAPGERPEGGAPAVGIGGATEGEPKHDHDPARPPGGSLRSFGEPGTESGATGGSAD